MANLEFEDYKQKLYVNYKTFAIFNFPSSLRSIDAIIEELAHLDVAYYTASYIPTALLVFRNSCHLCRVNYRDIFNYEFCLLLTIDSNDIDTIVDKMRPISWELKFQLLCQMKLCSDSVCPLMVEQQRERSDLQENLMNIVEEWFSDEQIYGHKEILVAMNSAGWVPLTVVADKLEDVVAVQTDEIVAKLRHSAVLELDATASCVRRVNAELPWSKEHLQMVLLDIPDAVKSIRQMPGYLQIDGSTVDYFDYSIHAAIISLRTREEAIQLVRDVQESGKMKAKLLVPCIGAGADGDGAHCGGGEQTDIDIQKMLHRLSLQQQPQEQIHIARLAPHELTHRFPDGFVPPDRSLIAAIVKQCNFYFSDANVLKDLFVLKRIKSNAGGWVELAVVAGFKQMVRLSGDSIDAVVYAMCFSDEVQISRDGRSLRRRLPLPEWDPSIYVRSLFLWNLPPHACNRYDQLDDAFCAEGRFAVRVSRFIRANRNVPADLRKLCDKIPALGTQNCGVVEFETREAMLAADEFIHMKWASVKTFYLDTKEELPKPAVIVGKASKFLPPPIPVSTLSDDRVAALQAGTRIDPRFWQVARLLSAKKRSEIRVYNNEHLPSSKAAADGPVISVASFHWASNDFPPLTGGDATGAKGSKRQHKKRQPLQPTDATGHKKLSSRASYKKTRVGHGRQVTPSKKENSSPVTAGDW